MATKNVVALYSVSPFLGSDFYRFLAKAHDEGKITLILIHLESGDVHETFDPYEQRVLDYADSDDDQVATALKGVDILISAVRAREGDTSDFYKRLAKVKTLTTFFPFDYSVNWSAEELEDVELGASITAGLNKEAEQLGIPLTVIHSGVFLDFFLEPSVVGVDLLNNKLALFGDALKRKIPVTRASYLGQAVAELVSGPKDKLPGTHYTVVEASWTGQEIADALEKVNGAKPQISEITDRALREDYDAAPESKALKRKWGAGEFPNPDPFNPKNVTPMNIDEMFAAIKKIRTTKIE